jgi:GMP reductase
MCGSMFAGHDECAGEITTDEFGFKHKIFYGMSSKSAMNKYHGGVAKYRSAEGKTVKVTYKGPVQGTVESILGGLRSTCTYVGARKLKDLAKCTTFMRVTN